jgi:hypothetical protein
MKIPEPEILKTRCVTTVIGGKIFFARWVRNEEEGERD